MPYLPSPGRCIYCPSTVGLTDEHIIPQSLGGRLVLQEASCEDCRKITSEFERAVTREMYWPLRIRLGLLGSRKHKKERPKHWPGILQDGDKIEEMPIEVGKFPIIYCAMEMAPPGIITGEPPHNGNPELKIHIKADKDDIARFMKEVGVGKFEPQFTLEWNPFSRMIAKICHAHAVSIIGLTGVTFQLPALIRGESGHLAQFVGGIDQPAYELPAANDLGLGVREIGGKPYLFATTSIFGGRRFPTYQAIVGQIGDLDLILTKIACAQQQ